MTGAAAEAHDVWAKAREENDFELFLPSRARGRAEAPLHRLLRRLRRAVRRAPRRLRARDEDRRGAVFDELKAELVLLIAEIGLEVEGDDAFMSGPWPIDAQHAYSLEIIKRFGFDESFARPRPDRAPVRGQLGHPGHPPDDALQGGRHRRRSSRRCTSAGTGSTSTGSRPRLERTPLCHGVSSALHESQSRTRTSSAAAASSGTTSTCRSRSGLPEAIGDVDQERFYRAINRVKPSHVRVDADEATYNLHIILRFELEQEIFAGTIGLADPPAEWNRRFEEYLGIRCRRTRSASCRTHWSGGGFASPTYSLGNIVSVQIWRASSRSCPTCRSSSSRASSGSCTSGCRPACTRSAGSSPRSRDARAGGRHTGIDGAYVRYLKDKRARSRPHRESVWPSASTRSSSAADRPACPRAGDAARRRARCARARPGRPGVAAGARWDSFGLNTPNWAQPARVRLCRPGAGCVRAARRGDRLPRTTPRVRCTGARGRLGDSLRARPGKGGYWTHEGGAVHGRIGRRRHRRLPAADAVTAARRSSTRGVPAAHGGVPEPGRAPDGAVLVVGSGQSGCQVAEDLLDAGRAVYLSVGGARGCRAATAAATSSTGWPRQACFDQDGRHADRAERRSHATPL